MTDVSLLEIENNATAFARVVAFHSETPDRNPYHPSVIFELHSIISSDLYDFAGQKRTAIHEVVVGGAPFTPAAAHMISSDLVDLCDDVEQRVAKKPTYAEAVMLSAELLHRLLCIHPFQDGNGRTARAFHLLASYNMGILEPPQHLFEYFGLLREPYLRSLSLADKGDYGPLYEYIARGLTDIREQAIADAITQSSSYAYIERRLHGKKKRFLDRKYRLRLSGKTYEKEKRQFFSSIDRIIDDLLKELDEAHSD